MFKLQKNSVISFQTRTKQTYEDKISLKSFSSKTNFDASHKQFSKFTEKSFKEKLEHIIEDLLLIKDPKEQQQKTFDVLQNFVNYLDGEGIAPSTNRVYFNSIKKYLKYRGFEIHNDDVKNEIDFPVIVEEMEYALTNKDISKLLFYANPEKKMLYLVLASSGMRIEETLRLRKRDFSFELDRIMISIPGKYTKTKKPRITFVSSEAEKILKPHLKRTYDDQLVFTDDEDYLKVKNSAEKYFERVREKAEFLEKRDTGTHLVTLHSLRSFFITKCNRIDFGLGNTLAGHGYYMKKYERFSINDKLNFYLEAEPSLLIDVERIIETNPEFEEQKSEIEKLKHRVFDLEFDYRELFEDLMIDDPDRKDWIKASKKAYWKERENES